MRKTVHLGTKLASFASAADSVAETLEVELTTKRVERQTERIGQERVAERELAIAEWEALPLVEKLAAPNGVKAPAVVCVSCDGGRMQRCDLPADAKSHWCETKVGVLMEIAPNPHDADPCPQVPDKFLDLVHMEQVTREIKGAVPKGQTFAASEKSRPAPRHATETGSGQAADSTKTDSQKTDSQKTDSQKTDSQNGDSQNGDSREAVAAAREEIVAEPPVVASRDVVASLADSTVFGKQLATHAWWLGFAAALVKVFIADGSSTNWGIWQRHFKHLGFVPLPPDVADTDPRKIVADTLTYLTNQQSRMNYPAYRRLGLPMTSSHIESTVKQISRRVKGSEKFWTEEGGEALLQLRADQICDTTPLDTFWLRRTRQATGTRNYKRLTQITA